MKRLYGTHTFEYINRSSKKESYDKRLPDNFDMNTLAVDAACSGNPGPMEYRGVYLLTGQQIFHFGPIFGTNNIGEFFGNCSRSCTDEAERCRDDDLLR